MLIIPDACLGVKYDNVVVHRLPIISNTFFTIDIKKNSEVVRPEAAGYTSGINNGRQIYFKYSMTSE
jgi:hypothetical protein